MTNHVYVIFHLEKRRFWFGRRMELAHVATAKEGAQEWLRKAMERVRTQEGAHIAIHDRYRWCTSSIDNEYGKGSTGWPANAADIFYTEHYGYE